jgi:hypothetical protein
MNRGTEKGNAIIWILIAVGLFAALGYAFTSTSRQSTAVLTNTEANAYANQIMAHGQELKAAVQRVSLRGCDDNEISFENNVTPGYANPYSPTNGKCHIYNSAGGGLSWWINNNIRVPESTVTSTGNYLTHYQEDGYKHTVRFSPYNNIIDMGTTDGASEAVDLVATVPFIKQEICEAINRKLGLSASLRAGTDVNGWANFGTKFIGNYTPYGSALNPNQTNREFCLNTDQGGSTYYFYVNVLKPR